MSAYFSILWMTINQSKDIIRKNSRRERCYPRTQFYWISSYVRNLHVLEIRVQSGNVLNALTWSDHTESTFTSGFGCTASIMFPIRLVFPKRFPFGLSKYCYRPQTKFAKVMFLHVSVILSTGGAIPACIAGGIPACLAAGLQGDLQAHSQGGSWGGSGPGPQPRGKLKGSGQAHSQGGSWEWGGVCSGGCLLQGEGRVPAPGVPAWGVSAQGGVCSGGVETPQTATAAGSTHPTGMYSCSQ